MKANILIVICVSSVVAGTSYWHFVTTKKLDALTFSNTQTWDELLSPLRFEKTTIVDSESSNIYIPPFPKNTSSTTKRELKQLHDKALLRNEETLARIELEKEFVNAYIGGYTYAEITSTSTHPFTSYFIQLPLHELSFLIMKYKDSFNRVRPSYLDTSLTTAIAVPNHPSYPSGHATQSYFVALMMSELDPANREAYIQSAYKIAEGREIAGVHYPSDSEAGRSLATQYFNLLKGTYWYMTYLELAKREWGTEKN